MTPVRPCSLLMSRRSAFAGSAAALLFGCRARSASRSPYGGPLAFAAFRNDRPLGEQRMTFDQDGDGLKVTTHVELTVKLGPVALYRYRHEAVEQWRGGRFWSLQTRTEANGKVQRLTASRQDRAVLIMPSGGAALSAPEGALPFTHWNRAIAASPLFDPQDGRLMTETSRDLGAGRVLLANGRGVTAYGVAFSGETAIEDWYDEAGVWTGLRGRLKDGSTLEYRRL